MNVPIYFGGMKKRIPRLSAKTIYFIDLKTKYERILTHRLT